MCKLLNELIFPIHSVLTNMQHLLSMISIIFYHIFSCMLAIVLLLIPNGFLVTVNYGTCGFRMSNIMLSDNRLMLVSSSSQLKSLKVCIWVFA